MGFTIHGYCGGSNSPDSRADSNEERQQTLLRLRRGIRVNSVAVSESACLSSQEFDTESINRQASTSCPSELQAATAELVNHCRLRAASPEGFTAPGARSKSAYDLAPLILCHKEI